MGIGRRSRISVKRSSLLLCERSALARQFDPQTAPLPADGINAPAGSEHSDDSDGDDSGSHFPLLFPRTKLMRPCGTGMATGGAGAPTIEQDCQCFGKLIDQLRLIAIATPGDPPPPPLLRGHEEAEFAKLLSSYFGGVEDFIKTNGEHRLVGAGVALSPHCPLTAPLLGSLQKTEMTSPCRRQRPGSSCGASAVRVQWECRGGNFELHCDGGRHSGVVKPLPVGKGTRVGSQRSRSACSTQ